MSRRLAYKCRLVDYEFPGAMCHIDYNIVPGRDRGSTFGGAPIGHVNIGARMDRTKNNGR